MKKMKLVRNIADVMFWGNVAGLAFSGAMMMLSSHPIRSFAGILACMILVLVFANMEVWADGQIRLIREAERAKSAYKQTKKNRLGELYEKAG